MNDENLIPMSMRSAREVRELGAKGGKKAAKSIKKKKDEQKERESLAEILKNVIYTDVKPKKLKDMMKDLGIEKNNNYFAALSASALLEGIKKGDINALYKIMEILGEICSQKSVDANKDRSFDNLIGAIKSVRETNSKTE